MDEVGEKRVSANRSGESDDRISNLPDSLLCQILLNLPTKDLVKCRVLSSRWRNLWKDVPRLDLCNSDFPDYNTFVSFVDTYLGFNTEFSLQRFSLKYAYDGVVDPDQTDIISRWINTVVGRKVKRIDYLDESSGSWDVLFPSTLYTCESLVSLKLSGVTLPSPKSVSLPCLKVMDLILVHFEDVLGFETLISRCPVLETLFIERSFADDTEVLRVSSQSLLSFTHVSEGCEDLVEDLVVAVNAPRLKYMKLSDCRIANFVLENLSSLVDAYIDTMFNLSFKDKFNPNDLRKRNMIRNFLVGISSVKDMLIASSTLEVIYDYSRCEKLPLFRNLTFLRVRFTNYRWEMLPMFLENCPNLKYLVMGSAKNSEEEAGVSIIPGPRRFLSSLEYVEIKRPLKGEAMEMKLVSYLLENLANLKKLILYLDDSRKKEESVIFKDLLTIPRLSSACEVFVL